MLDGSRSLRDLVRLRPANLDENCLLRTLMLMHVKGLLVEGEVAFASGSSVERRTARDHPEIDPGRKRELLFWGRHLTLTGNLESAGEVPRILGAARLVLVATGTLGATAYDLLVRSGIRSISLVTFNGEDEIASILDGFPVPPAEIVRLQCASGAELGLALEQAVVGADMIVAAVRNAPAELIRTVNAAALEYGVDAIIANDRGEEAVIGPLINPFLSACHTCAELRRARVHEHAFEDHVYQERLATQTEAGAGGSHGEAVCFATLVSSIVVLEVVKHLTGIARPLTLDATLTIDPLFGSLRTHRVLRVPSCPSCYPGERLCGEMAVAG